MDYEEGLSLRETINGTTITDRLLLVILLIASLTGIVFIKDVLPKGAEVSIEVDGKDKYRYALDTDRVIDVKGDYGNLTVEIKNKKVRVSGASCSNKLCERQGWVDAGAIICLPNRISIIVGGGQKSKGRTLDAVTG